LEICVRYARRFQGRYPGVKQDLPVNTNAQILSHL